MEYYECPEDESWFIDVLRETGLVANFAAFKKLLPWQQTLNCLTLLTDLPQTENFSIRFLSTCRSYVPVTKSISVAMSKLFKFYHFIRRTSFLNRNLSKDYYTH